MARRVLAIACLAAMLATACGGSKARPFAGAQPSASISPGTSAPASPSTTDPASPQPSGSATAASKGKSSPSPLPSGPGARNTMPLKVSLDKTCAEIGDTMRATARTEKDTKLAFTASYANNGLVPDLMYVDDEQNVTGTFTWTWVIRPEVEPGNALVTVVAAKDRRGASFKAPFVVARAC